MTLRLRIVHLLVVLMLVGIAAGACGGSNTPTTRLSPTPTDDSHAATRTTAASTVTPGADGVIRELVTSRLATETGRADCPTAWLGFENAAISVCYPPAYHAETIVISSTPDPYLVLRLIPGDPVAQTASTLSLHTLATYAPLTNCEFDAEQVDTSAETSLAPYELGGSEGVACTARTTYATQFNGSAPAPSGAVEFRAYAATAEQLALAMSILSTMRLK